MQSNLQFTLKQTAQYRESMQRVLAHNNTLPEAALRRSLVHNGEPSRLHRFFKNVLAGGSTSLLLSQCGSAIRNSSTCTSLGSGQLSCGEQVRMFRRCCLAAASVRGVTRTTAAQRRTLAKQRCAPHPAFLSTLSCS